MFLAASEGALRCSPLPVLRSSVRTHPGVHLRIKANYSTPQAVAALHETTADFAVTTPAALSPSLTQTSRAANSSRRLSARQAGKIRDGLR